MDINQPKFELLFDLKRLLEERNIITHVFGDCLQIYPNESVYEVHLRGDKLVIKTENGKEEWDNIPALYFRLIGLMEKDIKVDDEAWADIARHSFSGEDLIMCAEASKRERYIEINTMETVKDTETSVKCICCDKDIKILDHGCLDDAGYAYLEFGYGSRHDQCKGFGGQRIHCKDGEKPSRRTLLLACEHIIAHICDDCAEKKFEHCKGYVRQTTYKHERKV
jgi:hypothetical protein